jgi:hypothetical protein
VAALAAVCAAKPDAAGCAAIRLALAFTAACAGRGELPPMSTAMAAAIPAAAVAKLGAAYPCVDPSSASATTAEAYTQVVLGCPGALAAAGQMLLVTVQLGAAGAPEVSGFHVVARDPAAEKPVPAGCRPASGGGCDMQAVAARCASFDDFGAIELLPAAEKTAFCCSECAALVRAQFRACAVAMPVVVAQLAAVLGVCAPADARGACAADGQSGH